MIRTKSWLIPTAVVFAAAIGAGCSSSGANANGTSTTTPAPAASTTSIGSSGTQASSSTTASSQVASKFAAIEGSYVAGTEDGGSLYIRGDGASRFLAPDDASCPTCTTAASPIASIDITLQSLTAGGGGAYRAAGVVSGISDMPWAAAFAHLAVGSAVTVNLPAGRTASISFLPANDVLRYSTKAAAYTNTPPCTVAAARGPVQAAESGAKVNGVNCAVDKEWLEASVSYNGIDEVKVLEAAYTNWIVVDRATVCNNHDVPTDFYTVACSTS